MARGLDGIYGNRKPEESRKSKEEIARENLEEMVRASESMKRLIDSLPDVDPEIEKAARRVRDMDIEAVQKEEKNEGINKSNNNPAQDEPVLPFTSTIDEIKQERERLVDKWKREEEERRQAELKRQEELGKIEEQKQKEEQERKEAERKKREEIENKINSVYSDIVSKMDNMYKTPILEDQISSLNRNIDEIMMRNDLTIDDLNKTLDDLTKLSPKVDSLYKEASEIKKEDIKINEQSNKQNDLSKYQEELKGKYGTAWFTKISEEEKAKYVELYSTAHGVSKESVEKNIEDSIALWNREHPPVEKEPVEKEEEKPLPGISNWDEGKKQEVEEKKEETPTYEWEAKETFKFAARTALDNLKEIYSMLGNATPEQVIEFKACYETLSNIHKSKPISKDDEARLMKNLLDVRDAIDKLKTDLSTMEYSDQSSGMSM